MLSFRVTSTRPTAYARSEANVEQIVYGLHEQAVCIFICVVWIVLHQMNFQHICIIFCSYVIYIIEQIVVFFFFLAKNLY